MTSLPFIVSFTGSRELKNQIGVMEYWSIGSGIPITPLLQYSIVPSACFHRAAFLLDMRFKLFPEFPNERRRRHRRGIAERTNRVSHDVAADIQN